MATKEDMQYASFQVSFYLYIIYCVNYGVSHLSCPISSQLYHTVHLYLLEHPMTTAVLWDTIYGALYPAILLSTHVRLGARGGAVG